MKESRGSAFPGESWREVFNDILQKAGRQDTRRSVDSEQRDRALNWRRWTADFSTETLQARLEWRYLVHDLNETSTQDTVSSKALTYKWRWNNILKKKKTNIENISPYQSCFTNYSQGCATRTENESDHNARIRKSPSKVIMKIQTNWECWWKNDRILYLTKYYVIILLLETNIMLIILLYPNWHNPKNLVQNNAQLEETLFEIQMVQEVEKLWHVLWCSWFQQSLGCPYPMSLYMALYVMAYALG